jgi:hypothetical protein
MESNEETREQILRKYFPEFIANKIEGYYKEIMSKKSPHKKDLGRYHFKKSTGFRYMRYTDHTADVIIKARTISDDNISPDNIIKLQTKHPFIYSLNKYFMLLYIYRYGPLVRCRFKQNDINIKSVHICINDNIVDKILPKNSYYIIEDYIPMFAIQYNSIYLQIEYDNIPNEIIAEYDFIMLPNNLTRKLCMGKNLVQINSKYYVTFGGMIFPYISEDQKEYPPKYWQK